ncbi:MAG: hypothetical protein EBU46_18295, partial [Nitrosomonadaceae bacterium]|nr:hypothetical protein [Nitrosomonadaceae bacterium]
GAGRRRAVEAGGHVHAHLHRPVGAGQHVGGRAFEPEAREAAAPVGEVRRLGAGAPAADAGRVGRRAALRPASEAGRKAIQRADAPRHPMRFSRHL